MANSSQTIRYNIILRPEPEGGFTVVVPALPGCVTYGKNLAEARKMAREAIELYLESLIEDGETIPESDQAYIGSIEVTSPRVRKSRVAAHA